MKARRRARLTALRELVRPALSALGAGARVEQAQVVLEWAERVGPQIAAVSRARAVTPDGTLFVDVASSAWANELALMQHTLLELANRGLARRRITRIRWSVAPLDDPPPTL
jgi:predicted nucleic acid-binding Zn ribbon protein